ncbi:MAG TPA: methionyl-tRNA formyltransferase [Spirochaetota bacterium]|nr:methionyl-tRNA formyltransferase [Spirochaetota bacterium]HPC40692.1 methionyl-tRNA formyltransferase [Spirochaetota bacterium]HPL17868.1 methionyl-tRNA formyltransferase [Spirochaetota bacterium]HQF09400.1 methionyl-tRNA formyltransferase [Spirochaetota bacterium]HQH97986.1 methionyl-tRNA formyltransferase [Spirochaetota bacterium]
MKIGFFGTPELAARVLAGLRERHEVLFAVTAEDKEAGRNRALHCCQAKEEAMRLGIPVLQPKSLKDSAFMEELRSYDADIYAVVAYGNLIPRAVFDYPPLKTINLHPSLLPKYRGAAPVQWALINGESETGITVQLINEKLDAGDIVVQERLPLDRRMTAGDVMEIVSCRGARLMDSAIGILASGSARPVRQDESEATYCGKIDKDLPKIDWSRSAEEIHNLVRGLNPKPVAVASFRGEAVKIWKTALPEADVPGTDGPGSLVRYHKKRLFAETGRGMIEILSLQPANKKVMDGLSFINGYRLTTEDRFE